MTNEAGDVESELIFLLDLDPEHTILHDYTIGNLTVDILFEEAETKYYVELRKKATVEAVAYLNMLKTLLSDQGRGSNRFVLASRSIPPEVRALANTLQIEIIQLMSSTITSGDHHQERGGAIKLTTDKSWRVVAELIKEKRSSVRNLATRTKVSYGWAHAVAERLLEQGIAVRDRNSVYLKDIDKLLNGVAWERPINKLVSLDVMSGEKDALSLVRTIVSDLDAQGIAFAFSCYMAGTAYVGQSIRFDSIQLYLPAGDQKVVQNLYAEETGTTRIQVMTPDRDIFSEARWQDNIRVTSPAQTLLDLAGMGYKGRDLTKAMVESLARL